MNEKTYFILNPNGESARTPKGEELLPREVDVIFPNGNKLPAYSMIGQGTSKRFAFYLIPTNPNYEKQAIRKRNYVVIFGVKKDNKIHFITASFWLGKNHFYDYDLDELCELVSKELFYSKGFNVAKKVEKAFEKEANEKFDLEGIKLTAKKSTEADFRHLLRKK